MSGQLSDFLAAHAQQVGDLWTTALGGEGARSMPTGRGPRQFINAVLVALSADDLKPLSAYHELDPAKPAGLDQRLDAALRQLDLLARVADQVAAQEKMEPRARLALALSAAEDLNAVGRRLVGSCVGRLASQVSSINKAGSARGASLSITMHELRRPLTILNSYGQLLSAGMLGAMPESAMVAIEGITASTEMMVRMVNALAEVSRLEDPDDQLSLEHMTVAELVNGAVEHVAMEAKLRAADISTDLDPRLEIRADRRRVTLALTNMLSNAVKHAPEGSAISVRTVLDREGVHFIIKDSGPGFPPEDAANLFEKYYRSAAERNRKVPGSGLGLFIVRTVAERHRGRVAARSQPGKGAEFELVLPLNPGS